MQYFGVPRCPYCKKRVNLIRTWSLKRQGEYKCPRCSGISNIYLSPLIYVFALIAIFAGGAIYFFYKFVLNEISLMTVIQVVIPFVIFFLLSLFLVYLQKPVIKKAPMKRRRGGPNNPVRSGPPPRDMVYDTGKMFQDDEYMPKSNYQPGPMPRNRQGRSAVDGHTAVMPPVNPPVRSMPENGGTRVMDTQTIRAASQPSQRPVRQVPQRRSIPQPGQQRPRPAPQSVQRPKQVLPQVPMPQSLHTPENTVKPLGAQKPVGQIEIDEDFFKHS